jgi:hypothetical protein
MVDNNSKPMTRQELLDAMTDEDAQNSGYPSVEVFRLEFQLVNLGWALSDGDESVHDEYYALVDEMLAKGWSPELLDGQQEVMIGGKLYKEMFEKYKAKVKQQL